MAFYESTMWSVILWALMACLFGGVAADFMRVVSVRGTYERYLWASIERVTMAPGVVGPILMVVENIAQQDWMWAGGMTAASALHFLTLARFRRDNDDDWFNTGGPGRLLGRLLPRRRAAPQGT